MKSKFLSVLLTIGTLLTLCACQANPQSSVVTSKGDGSFDASIVVTDEEREKTGVEILYDYDEQFSSLDGSVIFQFKINSALTDCNMPVVEVCPHNFTTEDARRIANALFGDIQFFEFDPNKTLTKDEIRKNIALWTKYLTEDALEELYGTDDAVLLSQTKSKIQEYIEEYTSLIDTAPDSVEGVPCQWTFFPVSHYWKFPEENTTLEDKSGQIEASAEVNGYSYLYSITSRNEKDYKINNIFVYFDLDDGPYQLNSYIQMQELCKTGAPTEEQLIVIKEKTQKMLDAMEIGTWYVDQCYYEPIDYGGEGMYVVYTKAVPMFNGVCAVRQKQLDNLKSTEAYASNYYYTDAEFSFSADGVLLDCSIFSPVDVTQIINDNVKMLSFEELIQKAKTNLELRDYFEYANNVIYGDEKFNCTVNITELVYGLSRVKVPDTADSYYYVPAMTLRGDYQAYDEAGNLRFDSNSFWENEPQTLLVINAVDGSIINASNGY